MDIVKAKDLEGNWKAIHTESMDDLWYLKNIMTPGTIIRKTVLRRDEKRDDMSRSKESSKRPVTVSVKVEGSEFQPYTDRLRIRGIVCDGPMELMGEHQSVQVSSDDDIDIFRENWGDFAGSLVKESMMKGSGGGVIVIMDDENAIITILRDYGIHNVGTINSGKSGKYYASNYSRDNYFKEILNVLVSTEPGKPVVITGPGFEGANFMEFAVEHEPSRKFMQVQSTGNTESAVYEIIGLENIKSFIGSSRLSVEKSFMEDFLRELGKNGLCTYGRADLEKNASAGSISKLLVLETVIRDQWVRDLMEMASSSGAEVVVASEHGEHSMAISGFGGVLAILRYRIN